MNEFNKYVKTNYLGPKNVPNKRQTNRCETCRSNWNIFMVCISLILSVKLKTVDDTDIIITCGYGYQESADEDKVKEFYENLDNIIQEHNEEKHITLCIEETIDTFAGKKTVITGRVSSSLDSANFRTTVK